MQPQDADEEFCDFYFVQWFRKRQEKEIIEHCERHPEYLQFKHGDAGLVMLASEWNTPKVLKYVLERSLENINTSVGVLGTPLSQAVSEGKPELAKMLLEAGADPNAERLIVSAVIRSTPEKLECLKLLLAHAVDVNRLYSMFGSREAPRTVLDFASGNAEAMKLLRAAGAKTAAELLAIDPETPIEGVKE